MLLLRPLRELITPIAWAEGGNDMATATRTERIQDVLRSLRAASPEIVGSAIVSTDESRVKVVVMPTNEELAIATETERLVGVAN